MTVSQLISKLMAYSREHPTNAARHVYLCVDGEGCLPFGSALNADGIETHQSYLIISPENGSKGFKMRQGNLVL